VQSYSVKLKAKLFKSQNALPHLYPPPPRGRGRIKEGVENSKLITNPKRLEFGTLEFRISFRISPQPLLKGWAIQPLEKGLWSDLGFRI